MTKSKAMPARAPSKEELCAYVEFLFMKRRLLCMELWPDQVRPGGDNMPLGFSPVGTAAHSFHFPNDGRTWQDVPKPSTRCLKVFEAIKLDAANSTWLADTGAVCDDSEEVSS
jgi:hypothetical protein